MCGGRYGARGGRYGALAAINGCRATGGEGCRPSAVPAGPLRRGGQACTLTRMHSHALVHTQPHELVHTHTQAQAFARAHHGLCSCNCAVCLHARPRALAHLHCAFGCALVCAQAPAVGSPRALAPSRTAAHTLMWLHAHALALSCTLRAPTRAPQTPCMLRAHTRAHVPLTHSELTLVPHTHRTLTLVLHTH